MDDYDDAKRQLRSIRMREALHRERVVKRFTQGGNSEHSLHAIAQAAPHAHNTTATALEQPHSGGEKRDEEDEDEEEEESNDAAFSEYKAQRLAQLHNSLSAATALQRPPVSAVAQRS